MNRVLLAVVLLAAATPAAAQEITGQVVRKASPRTMILQLTLGIDYYPAIDTEKGLDNAPFRSNFGGKDRLFPQLTAERIIWDEVGTVSAGVGIGYAEFYGHAFFTGSNGERSSDSTSFRMLPLWALASYRFDWPAEHLGIPIVPFAQAGLGYWMWWANPANGGKTGWMWSAGGALLLNPFDPRLSREFDADAGVNGSYLVVQYTDWMVDGFGAKGFDLSDKVLSLGLALAF